MFLMCILFMVGLAIAAVTAFAFCWAFFPVATTPIAGQRAIASLETITLGGVEQSILIRAEDASNPIVLLLHGGPGLPLMPFRSGFAALEKDFVVVYWDQYGSGKSCEWSTFLVSSSSSSSPAPAWQEHDHHHRHGSSDTDEPADNAADGQRQASAGRTPCRRCGAHRWDRFGDFEEDEPAGPQRRIDLASTLQDTEELVSYLCRRFHQRAVALVAHDSGSVVAMQFARQHPELVRSVFLVAPLIDFGRQHATALEWALDKARRERQYALLSQLEATGGGVTLPLANATQLLKLRRAVAELGGDMRRGGFVLKLLHHIFSASEYGVGDKLTLVPCGIQSAAHQFNDLRQVNLTEQVRAVDVPVAMACGKWDRLAPCALVEEYLHALRTTAAASAPASSPSSATSTESPTTALPHVRELVVFAQSAHWPFIEEGEIFVERLREHLLTVQ